MVSQFRHFTVTSGAFSFSGFTQCSVWQRKRHKIETSNRISFNVWSWSDVANWNPFCIFVSTFYIFLTAFLLQILQILDFFLVCNTHLKIKTTTTKADASDCQHFSNPNLKGSVWKVKTHQTRNKIDCWLIKETALHMYKLIKVQNFHYNWIWLELDNSSCSSEQWRWTGIKIQTSVL